MRTGSIVGDIASGIRLVLMILSSCLRPPALGGSEGACAAYTLALTPSPTTCLHPPPGATLIISRLVFHSKAAENPQSLPLLLAPHFITWLPGAALVLQDSRKITQLAPDEVEAGFKRVLGAPELQQALQQWRFVIYTVRLQQRQHQQQRAATAAAVAAARGVKELRKQRSWK